MLLTADFQNKTFKTALSPAVDSLSHTSIGSLLIDDQDTSTKTVSGEEP